MQPESGVDKGTCVACAARAAADFTGSFEYNPERLYARFSVCPSLAIFFSSFAFLWGFSSLAAVKTVGGLRTHLPPTSEDFAVSAVLTDPISDSSFSNSTFSS